MPDPARAFDPGIEELRAELRRLESRVEALERGAARVIRRTTTSAIAVDNEAAAGVGELPRRTVALLGRSLLVLAGAYLVRVLTEEQVLPAWMGVLLGLVYASWWQIEAARSARGGHRDSAAFHGLTSGLIGFPLVWEATVRFGLLDPGVAFALVVLLFALGLVVASRERLAVNAVLVTALAAVTTLVLLVSTHDLVAALVAFLALDAGLEWLACHDQWPGLRWGVALGLDAVAFLLVALLTRPAGLPPGYPEVSTLVAAFALLALPGLEIASLAARTLREGRPVGAHDIVQGSLAVVLGLGGAWHVLRAQDLPTIAPALLAVFLGLACYSVAFAFAERRAGASRNFYFYATGGALLTLAGTGGLGVGAWLPVAWSGLGLFAAAVGRRFDRATLRLHSAVYLVAAAFAAGAPSRWVSAFLSTIDGSLLSPTSVVAVAAAAAYLVLAAGAPPGTREWSRAPCLVLATVVSLALAHAVLLGLAGALGERAGRDGAVIGVARMAVLGGVAVGLALVARWRSWPELGWLSYAALAFWLSYAALAFGAFKLVLEDLRHGRSATLMLSLALYGAVLLLVPRLLREREG